MNSALGCNLNNCGYEAARDLRFSVLERGAVTLYRNMKRKTSPRIFGPPTCETLATHLSIKIPYSIGYFWHRFDRADDCRSFATNRRLLSFTVRELQEFSREPKSGIFSNFRWFLRFSDPSLKLNRRTECIFGISVQNYVEWHVFDLHLMTFIFVTQLS